ncbi:hypothetical protein Mpet_2004 [Methanolacinia petrolearia DSM 11571]|uniref:DUF3821 domain-containing protein n=1 Tax=Methanolacinia petrolearia (strain DSM 11571 / OCM 486 / SEBR 4847) TaxID=679926 RepID=E1RJE8_METP4|nr:hypothetical protein [Methanolacinia petrolearia]ADN36754.1 hypothetical protein Mpet_2004 [Methanolacinia petrolearia DSM 11571]
MRSNIAGKSTEFSPAWNPGNTIRGFIAFFLLCLIVSVSSAGVITEDSLYSENCYISPGFDYEVGLYPDITKSDGVLAKDQKFTATVTGEPGSEIGIWLYKAGAVGNPDKNVYVKYSVGSNGRLDGSGVILDDTQAYKLPSGRYYLYFVDGKSGLVQSDNFPESSDEFEKELKDDGSPYLKLEMYSEVPWIRYDQSTLPDITTGEELELSGTTNIASGKDLIVSIGPTALDDPYFKDQIIERTGIIEGDPYNTWEQSIDTSGLGPGEYMVVVEGSDVDSDAVTTFNVYNESYSVTDNEDDDLVVQTYAVDPDTKDLSGDQVPDSTPDNAGDNSGNMQQSPVETAYLVSMIAFVIAVAGYHRRMK